MTGTGRSSGIGLYWKLQLAGWGALFAWQLVMVGLFSEFAPRLGWAIAGFLLVAVLGMFLTHWFRPIMHRGAWKEMPPARLVPRVILATVGLASVMGAALVPLTIPNAQPDAALWQLFLSNTVGSAFAVVGWFLLYFCYHYLKRSREATEKELELRVAVRDGELRTLRTQLNPHFLFNSLNSLRALIPESPERAQEAVTSLAGLLRYSLRLSSRPTVPLEREIEAARHYLALEKIRFEERLDIRIDVSPGLEDQRVPPMVLQTLVENALRHGIAQRREGGTVRLDVFAEGSVDRTESLARGGSGRPSGGEKADAGVVVLSVRNPGVIGSPSTEGGVGLVNVRRQLALLWGDRARLELRQDGPDEVVCQVRIPRSTGTPSASHAHTLVEASA